MDSRHGLIFRHGGLPMPTDEIDLRHLRRALALAEQGRGWVEPNPLVGCVIARGEQVLAEGWHRKFGGPHAEIEALTAAGDVPRSHAVRHARALLPSGQNAPLHTRGDSGRNRSRRCRATGPVSPGRRPRFSGVAGGRRPGHQRRTAAGSEPTECALLETAAAATTVDHRQVGHVTRRKTGHHHRSQPVDLVDRFPTTRSPIAGTSRWNSDRQRHGRRR